jgi:hypothetical protein
VDAVAGDPGLDPPCPLLTDCWPTQNARAAEAAALPSPAFHSQLGSSSSKARYPGSAATALLWLAKMADDRPPPFSPGYVLDPRVLLEAPAAAAARAVTERGGPYGEAAAWMGAGVLGGLAFGATVGGPVGAVVGAGAGAVAAAVRGATGQSILQNWEELDIATKARLFGAGSASRDGGTLGMSVEQLQEVGGTPASEGEMCCKVCMDNRIVVALQPCGHACLCAPCCVQLGCVEAERLCPMCRTEVSAVVRVYI